MTHCGSSTVIITLMGDPPSRKAGGQVEEMCGMVTQIMPDLT